MEQLVIGRDVGHGTSVMCKTNVPFGINDTAQRHTSQLKELDLLLVFFGNQVIRVGETDKWYLLLFPILLEGWQRIRSNRQDFDTAAREFLIFIP